MLNFRQITLADRPWIQTALPAVRFHGVRIQLRQQSGMVPRGGFPHLCL